MVGLGNVNNTEGFSKANKYRNTISFRFKSEFSFTQLLQEPFRESDKTMVGLANVG
jgi:hypothetical protein